MSRGARSAVALVVVTLGALGACGGSDGASSTPTSSPPTSSSPTSSPPTSSAPTSEPSVEPSPEPAYVGGSLAECEIVRTASARVSATRVTGPGMRLPGIVFRPGRDVTGRADSARDAGTVVVLLHQTDGDGRCGWGPFGTAIARAGMTALAFDQCQWGRATCSIADPEDPVPQVRAALDYARDRLDARRVVLVGASMGGSRTVRAVAAGVRVDAWADISGPSDFDDVPLLPLARRIDTPGLVSTAPATDGYAEADLAERLARASGAVWIAAQGGHGYTILTDDDGALLPVGRRVIALAEGR